MQFVIGFFVGAFGASIVLTWWYMTHYDFENDRNRQDD
jgi:DNA-binding transcriptional regulator of glucitol operon